VGWADGMISDKVVELNESSTDTIGDGGGEVKLVSRMACEAEASWSRVATVDV
jgi:hypothetical protein